MTSMARSTSSRVTSRVFSCEMVRVTCRITSFPSWSGANLCNVWSALANPRVLGRQSLVKTNFRFPHWPRGRSFRASLSTPHKRPVHEARHDRHGVFREAEVQVPFVPEALESPSRAVIPQAPGRTRAISIDDTPGALVQLGSPAGQSLQDRPRRSLVLGGAPALPAATDYHQGVVASGGQLVGQSGCV